MALVEKLTSHDFSDAVPTCRHRELEPPRGTHQSPDEINATQLSRLASQHSKSDYNVLKFGIQGCSSTYTPLSIQMPAYFQELVATQLLNSSSPSWYLSGKSDAQIAVPPVLGPCGSNLSPSIEDLKEEISAAIASPIESRSLATPLFPLALAIGDRNRARNQVVKTSHSHPINISPLIPVDHVLVLSRFVYPSARRSFPVLFDIPPSYTLDPPSMARRSSLPIQIIHPKPASISTEQHVSEAIKAAINSGVTWNSTRRRSLDSGEPFKDVRGRTAAATIQKKSPWTMTFFSPRTLQPYNRSSSPTLVRSTSQSLNTPSSQSSSSIAPLKSPPSPTALSLSPIPSAKQNQLISQTTHTSRIGNLFLSSCPGKKVRLGGPLNGRNTVCRDLTTDLRRMWDGGVRCVICCLDDSELAFLGAPWSDYECAAKEVGLDVLRIPIPEGLAPLSTSSLDAHLLRVIEQYTLQGRDVLVHCRGGVGRAGVVAACWALKLGVCGWIETEVRGTCVDDDTKPGQCVRRDTLQIVERAISIVRRRRSIKAIETFEQVKFLVEYVEFLRNGEAGK